MNPQLSKIIDDQERQRRASLYGPSAKLRHLLVVFGAAAVVYVWVVIRLWASSVPTQHVVIDQVLVEVVADNTAFHYLAKLSGWVCLMAGAGIVLLKTPLPAVFSVPQQRSGADAAPKSSSSPPFSEGSNGGVSSLVSSSLALHPTKPIAGLWWMSQADQAAAAASSLGSMRSSNALMPLSSTIQNPQELDMLVRRETAQPQDRFNSEGGFGVLSSPAFGSATSSSRIFGRGAGAFVEAGGDPSSNPGGIAVRFEQDMHSERGNVRQATSAESELAALGILHPERSIMKIKQWMSLLCKTMMDDVDTCDQWFTDKRIKNFDCSNPLGEWYDLPTQQLNAMPRPTMGFGAAAAAATQQQERIRKTDALQNERKKLQLQHTTSFDVHESMHKIDLRLSLEQALDVTRTFPSGSGEVPVVIAARRQRGVLLRLRAFATQRSLSSFRMHPELPEVPADPYLLVHFLRCRVAQMSNYIQLPYQTVSQASRDLVLFVGGNGDPYFYVRHRVNGIERHMRTTEGPDSLFEALLLFFGVVRKYYNGCYGNVEGMIDLKKLDLETIF